MAEIELTAAGAPHQRLHVCIGGLADLSVGQVMPGDQRAQECDPCAQCRTCPRGGSLSYLADAGDLVELGQAGAPPNFDHAVDKGE